MKILTVIGARPQFIKAAAVSRIISNKKIQGFDIEEVIVHTGQHFDEKMSDIFFEEMEIPRPNYSLGINQLSHGAMTGQMLEKVEDLLFKEKPDIVLVYGDTNTTLAGALAAAKLHIKVAHVEAGLRSYNMLMPEEINRVLTDRISHILFCPTNQAVENLKKEGYPNLLKNGVIQRVEMVGDVMYDTAIYYNNKIDDKDNIYARYGVKKGEYHLATIHRAENTDDGKRLRDIFMALEEIASDRTIVLPIHPRTKKILNNLDLRIRNIKLIDPVGYFEMLTLLDGADLVFTDSGGLQKEAYFFKKFCITLRDETEWVELVENNVNFLTGADKDKILDTYNTIKGRSFDLKKELYGDGRAADKIVEILLSYV
ncbi:MULTISPECIES: non-hydrolyzing UDP-N-acetylglucosamine 2-epimerase [Calditerrivibrio]|jgi:UDP-GlcNAc3NAcA epimerase